MNVVPDYSSEVSNGEEHNDIRLQVPSLPAPKALDRAVYLQYEQPPGPRRCSRAPVPRKLDNIKTGKDV